MRNLKAFGYLFLTVLSAFMLGNYASSIQEIEPHRWVFTSFFGLWFLGMFLSEYKNDD